MSVKVIIPAPYRSKTHGRGEVFLDGKTVREVLDRLIRMFPDLSILLKNGELIRSVNIFIGEDDIRYNNGLDSTVLDGDEVSLVPAIAGG